MSRKQKRVVRRKSSPTKGKRSEIKKRTGSASNARKGGMGGNRRNARKGTARKTRTNKRAKTQKRKSAPRKSHAPRKRQQRQDKHPAVKKPKSRGRARQTDEDVFDEGEEFIGPIGDSYDDDFADIDWSEVDWDDVIDDIGDEEVDVYGDEAK